MKARKSYELIYDREVARHLEVIDKKYYSLIENTIKQQLSFEPDVETRNRKPLQKPTTMGATWELRFGPENRFRIFYRSDRETREVYILAIGTKKGNRLSVGGKRFEL